MRTTNFFLPSRLAANSEEYIEELYIFRKERKGMSFYLQDQLIVTFAFYLCKKNVNG